MNTARTAHRILNKYEIVLQAAAIAREALNNKVAVHMWTDTYSEDGIQNKEVVNALAVVQQLNKQLKKATLT